MSLFAALVRTTVNVVSLPVTLPLAVLCDTVTAVADAGDPECEVGARTRAVAQKIKDEAR